MGEMIRMADLPVGELAIWKNKRGTYFLFYTFTLRKNKKYMRILWTSSGTPIQFGVVVDGVLCEPLYVQTTENPYPIYSKFMRGIHNEVMEEIDVEGR